MARVGGDGPAVAGRRSTGAGPRSSRARPPPPSSWPPRRSTCMWSSPPTWLRRRSTGWWAAPWPARPRPRGYPAHDRRPGRRPRADRRRVQDPPQLADRAGAGRGASVEAPAPGRTRGTAHRPGRVQAVAVRRSSRGGLRAAGGALHLVHPDAFEAIVSPRTKRRVVEELAPDVAEGATVDTGDVDVALRSMRRMLAPRHGPHFAFIDLTSSPSG